MGMGTVLLLEPKGTDRDFFRDALRTAGFTVRASSNGNDARLVEGDLAGVDVILASGEVGLAMGWFRSVDAVPTPSVPIVIASEFRELLVVLQGLVAAVIAKPARPRDVVDAVCAALNETPPMSRPMSAPDPLESAARDAELVRRDMLDGSTDNELFAVADLVARGIDAPVGLVTVVDSKRQTFIGHVGLPADMELAGGTMRSWSFCQHAIRARVPLIVPDARDNPLFSHMPLVEMNMVRAYAGVPIEVDGIGAVGTVCALFDKPRQFTQTDIAVLELGARLVSARLARRAPIASGTESLPPPRSRAGIDPRIGTLLDGKYWITAPLGEGGQSSVVLGRDKLLGQLVAIKVMHEAPEGDATLVREARALSSVRHPNIVQLHGWGRTPEKQIYLVLEYVEGATLRDLIASSRAGASPIPLTRVTKIVRELAGALSSMHAVGIVHGDVKPSNVIMDDALDRSVLIDFGVGMSPPPGDANGPPSVRGGTPGFSAPEQFGLDRGVMPRPMLDVYGLAAIAYAMLVGEGPFARIRGLGRVAAQIRGEMIPPSVARPGLPKPLDDVMAAALSSDPSKRHDSVLVFADAFEKALASFASPPAARPSEPKSRGVAFRSYREEVMRQIGTSAEARVFASLSRADREAFAEATDDEEFYAARPLVAYLSAYADGDNSKIEALGAAVAGLVLPELIRTLKIARTPESLLHVCPVLLHRFHDWGHVDVRRVASDTASASVQLPEGFAPIMCHYLCGVMRGLLASTGRQATIEQASCLGMGGTSCEFTMTWPG